MGALGVIRSLGRGGYPVFACSSQPDAVGLRSSYAASAAVCPRYEDPRYLDWLRDFLTRHDIRAIVPSEGMLLALRPAFAEFAPLLPCSRREDTLYAGMSKCDVFKALAGDPETAAHLPPSLLLEEGDPDPTAADLEKLGLPLFLKVDGCHSRSGEGGTVHKAVSAAAACERLQDLRRRFRKVLIQGNVPGQGVGAFFLGWQGELLAEFQHRRLHEVPHDGGVSSLRESIHLPALRDDALAKLRRLNWEGVAMLEYRFDPAGGRFAFLELNGRFWGSLHLALFAGVDFPLLLLDAFHGRPQEPVSAYPTGVRCRHTFPAEVQYVWSRLRARGLPLPARAWSVLEFFLLSLHPGVYSDLSFPGDRKLYWQGAGRFCRQGLRSLWRRLAGRANGNA